MSDAIAALAKRFWNIHPREIQDLGITREQFYAQEMRALFTTQAADRIEALEKEVDKWHRVAMKAGAITYADGRHIYPLRDRIETLEAALREIDNMAPATCEVTLAHQMADCARAALAEGQDR